MLHIIFINCDKITILVIYVYIFLQNKKVILFIYFKKKNNPKSIYCLGVEFQK